MKDIHFFRAGKHVDSKGREFAFNAADLQEIATSYNAELHEAPIVVGHPKEDGPAFGWVESIKVEPDGLHASPKQVNPEFSDLVRQGAYKKVSASFFMPDHKNNPRPGSYYLRHIGFLGAAAPAVKGLAAVSFTDEDGISFAEIDLSELHEAQFNDCVRAFERDRVERVIRRANEEGRLPVGFVSGALAFAEMLQETDCFEFSEGPETIETNKLDWFLDFVAKLPIPVVIGELAKGHLVDFSGNFEPPPGFQVSAQRTQLDILAQHYVKAEGIPYVDAIRKAERKINMGEIW